MNTTFRRIAPHLWKNAKDPSTYGEVDIDLSAVEVLQKKIPIHLLAVLFKAIVEAYKVVPQVNSEIRRWKVYPKKTFAISLMVPHEKDDLCFATLPDMGQKSMSQIDSDLRKKLQQIRSQDGVLEYKKLFSVLQWIPRFVLPILAPILQYLMSRDFFKIPLIPRQPFGSIIVSNVGTLGFQRALLPLVPFTQASVMISLGLVEKRPLVIEDAVQIRSCVTIGFNLDHRIMDGFHAQRFLSAFKKVFEQPESYL
ncbi:2-oxo acid dehydrogenase subunit E2 [bacterium]|nr:2-oxo acid dehydrogenase subunit E2 [bacterium]